MINDVRGILDTSVQLLSSESAKGLVWGREGIDDDLATTVF